ncbi:unnamed protein product [Darwinula stevensoni]|uniref:Uncharacterized protein n=1 Tax=Darwinula stevensoni TaxID=69355 RepID=A0A7R9ACG1_9CRUS|nr:unnamed protein product [Darwinula stevensoni]CAG0899996.1 unnamed protein product [Darwinula stevensoni]
MERRDNSSLWRSPEHQSLLHEAYRGFEMGHGLPSGSTATPARTPTRKEKDVIPLIPCGQAIHGSLKQGSMFFGHQHRQFANLPMADGAILSKRERETWDKDYDPLTARRSFMNGLPGATRYLQTPLLKTQHLEL